MMYKTNTYTTPSISELRALFNGRVIAPDDPNYDRARTVFVGGIDRRPAAIIRVADAGDVARVVSLEWYEQLLGFPPTFIPDETEAVWELAEHRYVYIVQKPEHAGHARHTIFVDGLDALIAQIADRGLDPMKRETYSNGVRKITYRDLDGNEFGFGGAPLT